MDTTANWIIFGALAGAIGFCALITLPTLWLNRFWPEYAAERDLNNTNFVVVFALFSVFIGIFVGGVMGYYLAPLAIPERAWGLFDFCVTAVSFFVVQWWLGKVWPEPEKDESFVVAIIRKLSPMVPMLIYSAWIRDFLY